MQFCSTNKFSLLTIVVPFCSAPLGRQARKRQLWPCPFVLPSLAVKQEGTKINCRSALLRRSPKENSLTIAVPCCCFLSTAKQELPETFIEATPFCTALLGFVLKRSSLHVCLPRLLSASDHRARGACARVCLVFAVNDSSQGLAQTPKCSLQWFRNPSPRICAGGPVCCRVAAFVRVGGGVGVRRFTSTRVNISYKERCETSRRTARVHGAGLPRRTSAIDNY